MTTHGTEADRPRGRGRRPGGPDTRAGIIEAARGEFAAKGYDKASLRGIARQAGVDPALVHHYFEGKPQLFAQTLDIPVNPHDIIDTIIAGDPTQLGRRIITTFLTVWDPPERRQTFVALTRSSMTTDEAARVLREFLAREVFGRIARQTGIADPEVRAALAASQVLGMAVMRYILKVPALVEASNEEIVERLAPILQTHLVDNPVDEP